MPRPKICKNVCKMPDIKTFVSDKDNNLDHIKMTVEEFEVIRLMDKEGLNQEECATQMNVSRPTIQILYTNARKKVAEFLTTGATLEIDGGSFKLCPNRTEECNCTSCTCHEHKK